MSRSLVGPILLLLFAGLLLMLVGVTGIYAGLTLAERIHALLPPITADAAAIGGAAMALGAAALLAGALHIGGAIALRRRGETELVLVPAIALCSLMGILALGWGVAALVTVASGNAPADGMLLAGIGLWVLGAAYGWAVAVLIGVRRQAQPPI